MTKALPWSDEELTTLKQLWGNYSLSEIAHMLNKTNSGIAAKARKLKLPREALNTVSKAKNFLGSTKRRKPRTPPAEAYRWYGEAPKELLHLKESECLYQIEDSKLFCSGTRKPKSVYCPEHHSICYEKINLDRKPVRH